MPRYYVNNNAQNNGDHEVHEAGCDWLKRAVDTTPLGLLSNCHEAVRAAKRHHHQVNGCFYCCRPCHTG